MQVGEEEEKQGGEKERIGGENDRGECWKSKQPLQQTRQEGVLESEDEGREAVLHH